MPQIGANFQFISRQPNFERDQFDTVAHMAECTICDEGHICYCLETHKTYRFRTKDDNGNTKTYDNSKGGLGYWEEFQPGGGGGEGTITGATIGGNPVTESEGVLKFPAYPTVPITGIKDANNNTLTPDGGIVTLPTIPTVPISSIAKKTNDTNPITPSQGGRVNLDLTAEDVAYNSNKTVKDKLKDIDELIKDLTPDPSESSSTTIDLNLYSEWEDDESEYHSFIYDSSAIYVYETSSTSRITKTVSNVDHAVFKVSDRDIYIDYIISTSGNDTIYTANAIYNSSTLPSDFKEQFELGVYALIYRIIGRSGDSIPYGKTIITDTENKVLNVVYRDVVDNNVTKHQLIARAFDKNRIYIYETPDATYTKGYKFKISYGTSDSSFSTLNKLFGGGGDASDIEFDDQNINIGADNVQDAIRIAFTNIQSTTCTLNLTVYKDSAVLANKSVHIDVTYQGVVSSTLSGDYTTNSQGLISVSLPLGSIYTITFNNETNYRKPDTINGIADDNIKNISVLYEPVAENERIILICNIRGTTSAITANNKIAYIHYTNSDYTVNLSNDPEWTITFNNSGSPSSIVNEGVIKESILIPFGTYYTVELEDWDTSLQSDEQSFSKSPIIKTRALNESKVINLTYSYLLSGMFVVLKDDNDSAFGYTSYKVIDVDTQNDITTILINNVEYDIKYTAGIGIQKSIRGANEYEVWIASANMDTEIIGVGIKTQTLNDASLLAQEGIDQGYSKCSFMICKITYPTNGYTMDVQPITSRYDGKYGTINAVNAEVYSQCANAAYNITKVTGNHTQHGFLPSSYQWSTIFPANYLKIKSILASLNINISISGKYWLATRFQDAGGSGNSYGMAWGTNNGVNQDGNYNDAGLAKTWKCFPIFLFN